MHKVEPKVFLIGETKINQEGLQELLNYLGVPNWKSDAPTDIEKIIEVFGRSCYMSFQDENQKASVLNPNLTMVRKENKKYIENIIQKGDGSVLEAGFVNFFFGDVSRIFSAELCRHRVGTAISEKSLRFVRLTDMNFYAPIAIQENEEIMTIFYKTFEQLSELQKQLAKKLDLDNKDFSEKKKITSAIRRLAPMGLATTIGWSTNIRNLRHVIEMRTAPEAEEEIRLVFNKVAEIAIEKWPNLFGDYKKELVDGYYWYKTENRKV